ncbi:hypothetical protein LEP1GSC074_2737 [Leptospira noguchii str. Hook]|nr:hypothetical protein LEP1GSC072_4137 [Leptospira noguchii str. Bonito]EMS83934.1 hypothetical protein LEP1GSC074_2737 [Leptospira noguchii str. Hook]
MYFYELKIKEKKLGSKIQLWELTQKTESSDWLNHKSRSQNKNLNEDNKLKNKKFKKQL